MSKTPIIELTEIAQAASSGYESFNESFRALDALVQLAVKDKDLTTPPVSPVQGDRYIVPAGATGVWAGWERAIAFYTLTGWQYRRPRIGWIAWVEDESAIYTYGGTAWSKKIDTIPAGGTAGQLLTKQSATDYDFTWDDSPVPPPGTNGQVLTLSSGAAVWADPAGGAGGISGSTYVFADDFTISPTTTSQEIWDAYNTGSNSFVTTNDSFSGHPGVLTLDVGNTATGKAGILHSNNAATSLSTSVHLTGIFLHGDGVITMDAVFKLRTLPVDTTDDARFLIGLLNTCTNNTFGPYVALSCASDSAGVYRLTGITKQTGSGGTVNEVFGPAITNNQWYHGRIIINANKTNIEFFIDGTSIGSVTTNLPGGTTQADKMNHGLSYIKSSGTTRIQLDVDLYAYKHELTTARY